MPELPDITVYQERLAAKVAGQPLRAVRLASPFLLRTVAPPLSEFADRIVRGIERIGKRLVFVFDDERFLVLHLKIAGRLRWHPPGRAIGGRIDLAAFDFPGGTLVLTEAGTKKRVSLDAVAGRAGLAGFDRGGLEVLGSEPAAFLAVLRRENRTLKRALCDPSLFSGIGNAYSDEILHRAALSPVQRTGSTSEAEGLRLHAAVHDVLRHWIAVLRAEVGDGFPDKVTAFRPGMAVHGRYGQPCPVCQSPVQRIRYADNECNYCARCQCGGRLLADRGLSTLLKGDWPRTLEELEERRHGGR